MTHTITMKRDSLMSSGKKNKGHYFEKKPKTSWLVSMYEKMFIPGLVYTIVGSELEGQRL